MSCYNLAEITIEITPRIRYNIITGKKEVLLMDGFTNLMATMSIGMSQANVASQASIAMLKNVMNMDEAANAKMLESISTVAPSADGCGALMDVRA